VKWALLTRRIFGLTVISWLSHFFRLAVRLRGAERLPRVLLAIIRGAIDENVVSCKVSDDGDENVVVA